MVPDIIAFGKSLSNGLNPISGVWAKEDLLGPSTVPPGSTFSTFGANPLGTAAALEVLKMLSEDPPDALVAEKAARFMDGLQLLKQKYSIVANLASIGLAIRLEICRREDGFAPDRAATKRIVEDGLSGNLEADGKPIGLVLDVGG